MIDNQQKNQLLRMARLIAALYLVSTGVFAVVAYILPQRIGQPQLYDPPIINMLTLVLGLMAFSGIGMGLFLPAHIIKRIAPDYSPSKKFFLSTVFRCALFETPAICGLTLAVIGASLPVSLGFIIVSAGFLLYTFPTEEKISRFLSKIST